MRKYSVEELSSKNLFTTAEFARKMRWTKEYALQHARGWTDLRTGKTYSMPDGWVAISPRENPFGKEWRFFRPDQDDIKQILSSCGEQPGVKATGNSEDFRLVALQKLLEDAGIILDLRDKDLDKFLNRTISIINALTTDGELAERLLERWCNQVAVEDIADLTKHFNWLVGRHVGRPGLPALPQIVDGERLFQELREFYLASVIGRASTKLTLEFNPDGTVLINDRRLGAMPMSLVTLRTIAPIEPTLRDLLKFAWLYQSRFKKHSEISMDEVLEMWYQEPFVQAHPYAGELRRRCLRCGVPISSYRPNKRFCKVSHRSDYSKLLKRFASKCSSDSLAETAEPELLADVELHLSQIESNLRLPLNPEKTKLRRIK